jgi:putative phosphoesterase
LRIAIISDIHGNLPALEAAWRAVACAAPDITVCLGDLVQYGPSPGDVISFMRTHGVDAIQGNCDRAVGRNRRDTGDEFENPHWRNLASETLYWTMDNISAEARSYLKTLPDSRQFMINRRTALFVHGLPGNPSLGLPSQTAHEVYDMVLRRNDCRLFASGHTHEPLVVLRPEGLIINPGSVGGGTRPAGGTLAILDVAEGAEPYAEIVGFEYDIRELRQLYEKAGIPEVFLHCARLGRDPRGRWHTEDPRLRQEWARLSMS